MEQFLLIIAASIALKLLFMFGYRSTDFEVHRNWKALTYSLPISQWYSESTSEWTLDYPPLFAWFEHLLAQIGAYVDPKMCKISREPYASVPTIYFLRSTVIVTEFLMFFALWRLCTALANNATTVMKRKFIPTAILLAFNYGLILVDHIHFQYNGFLLGILLLSISFLAEKRFVAASVTFSILLNMKHIFMYMAPVYFVYILVAYCLEKPDPIQFLARLCKVGLAVLSVTFISFGPFIYMNQLQIIWARLFPFGRGLCHAYWAPNTWALYNTMDKLLSLLNSRYHFVPDSPSTVASMTDGKVGEIQHAILPNVRPVHTALLAFIGMMPSLIHCGVRSYSIGKSGTTAAGYVQFLIGLTATAWSSFLFGWHVHEKAVLMILIPLNLLAMAMPKYRYVAFYATTLGHYSLTPLIHTSAETPAVVSMFLAYTAIHWLILFRLHSVKVDARKPVRKPTEVGSFWLWLGSLHLCGLAALFLCTRVVYPWSKYHERFPFFPLMATSAYTALGLCAAFPYFVLLSFCGDHTGHDKTVTQPAAKGDGKKKLKVQ